jgi:hypothetical protein
MLHRSLAGSSVVSHFPASAGPGAIATVAFESTTDLQIACSVDRQLRRILE